MQIDLHVHSEESDGSLPVCEVIRFAAEQGIKILSLTDHETTNGVAEAVQLGSLHGIEVIPGVELVTAFKEREVHLLGYFDTHKEQNQQLQSRLQELRHQRTSLAYEMVKCLQNDGFTLKWAEVEKVASPEGVVSKGHIMRALYQHEHGNIKWSSMAKFFQPRGIAYLPFLELPYEDAVDFIYYCGGIPVLAHPGLLKDITLVKKLLDYRPIGLEVYYGYWEDRELLISTFEELAQEKALFSTGGSDFHGFHGPVQIGQIDVPEYCVTNLKRHLNIKSNKEL